MAKRKWTADSIGDWIADAARRGLEAEARRPFADDLARLESLDQLDPVALQSLGVRLGAAVWQRRDPANLEPLATTVVRLQAAGESYAVSQRAFLTALNALLDAVASGDAPIVATGDPARIAGLADRYVRGRLDDAGVVTPGFVRGLIEPLLARDRSTFRSLLGALSGTLVKLESAGLDGRIDSPLELPLYRELKALQWLLNGVLQAAPRKARAHAGSTSGASAKTQAFS